MEKNEEDIMNDIRERTAEEIAKDIKEIGKLMPIRNIVPEETQENPISITPCGPSVKKVFFEEYGGEDPSRN